MFKHFKTDLNDFEAKKSIRLRSICSEILDRNSDRIICYLIISFGPEWVMDPFTVIFYSPVQNNIGPNFSDGLTFVT